VQIDYAALLPEIIVAAAACLVLMVDLTTRGRGRAAGNVIALFATGFALLATVTLYGTQPRSTLAGMFVLDDFAVVMKIIFLLATGFVIWVSIPPMRGHRYEGEYAFLLLCSLLGCLLMPSSRDLLMLFIALELVSAPAFVIAGLRKLNPKSNEAALKFFVFGVLSAGVLIYGISLIYGFTGTTNLAKIATAVARGSDQPRQMLLIGVLFVVAAFGFKISAVPFHFWAPDTYEGSPTPLAAFLSVVSKGAGFVGLLLILLLGFSTLSEFWGPVIALISVATMTLGNVLALRQTQIVRLLAYSSIAQAGYMLIPVALISPHEGLITGSNAQQVRSLVTYLAVYALMNLGAFAIVIGLSKQYPTLLLRDLAGLGRRVPLAALALAGFMISLGGIPPFAGWFAKFAVFTAAIERGTTLGVGLAVFMVLNSVISLYYYVGVVKAMYMQESEREDTVTLPRPIAVAAGVAFVGVVVLGVYPEPFARLASAARIVLAG
jgi:NADH-quinone oxidoreductase subunit N